MIEGNIISCNAQDLAKMKKSIEELSTKVSQTNGCEVAVDVVEFNPPVINHKHQTERVVETCRECFGEEHFSQDGLPVSQDLNFSLYLKERPGCLIGIGSMEEGQVNYDQGHPKYNYNDKILASSIYFQTRLIEDRLGVEILPPLE